MPSRKSYNPTVGPVGFVESFAMKNHSRLNDRDKSAGEELDEGVIEVQVIPQDDNWGETATTITETTGTSVISGASETNLSDIGKDFRACRFNFRRHCGFAITVLFGLIGVLSPVAFVVIPIVLWEPEGCLGKCDGLYMSLGFREVILIAGIWALYFRRPRINFPRVNRLKVGIMGLAFIIVMSYWVIYGFRVLERKTKSYECGAESEYRAQCESIAQSEYIAQFALSLADTLLFVHYLSLVALWFRQSRVTYTMKVIRSTDGFSRFYNVGVMSIQHASAFVLNHYYKDFPEFNPLLMRIPTSRSSQKKETTNIKFYDIDGGKLANDSSTSNSRARAVIAATARKRESRHNDRFYEEEEYNRRVKKRRARLTTATEEAFTHVKKLKFDRDRSVPLDAEEAAQAIFPSLARHLQKYLRTTRQQYRYSMDSILKHLAHCLIFDMSPKAFLERYLVDQPCVQLLAENIKTWSLICEEQLTSNISKSTVFQLLRDEYSLVVTINELPQYDIVEEDFHFDDNQFVLRLNSETSV